MQLKVQTPLHWLQLPAVVAYVNSASTNDNSICITANAREHTNQTMDSLTTGQTRWLPRKTESWDMLASWQWWRTFCIQHFQVLLVAKTIGYSYSNNALILVLLSVQQCMQTCCQIADTHRWFLSSKINILRNQTNCLHSIQKNITYKRDDGSKE